MSQMNNRCYRLRHRPTGAVTDDDLEFLQEPIPSIGPGQALVRTLGLSLDPANRIWMSEIHYNMPPVPIGGIMRGFGIGQVVWTQRTYGSRQPGERCLIRRSTWLAHPSRR
jgi:NADPH-dependent curcumin reductase CurA